MADLQAFWQSLNPIEGDDSKFLVRAIVTDNIQKVPVELTTGSLREVVAVCSNALNNVNDANDLKSAFAPGAEIDLHQFDSPAPTPDQIALNNFLLAYNAYQSGFRKIQVGLLQADDVDVAALLADAQKKYKSAYAGIG